MSRGRVRRRKSYTLTLTQKYAEVFRDCGPSLSALVDEMLSVLRKNASARGFEDALRLAAEQGLELLRREGCLTGKDKFFAV